jgi:hypothetical protein
LAIAATLSTAAPARAQPEPQRILVFGDSQAQGLAGGIQRQFRGDRDHRVLDRSKISTGLARLTYDWPAQARVIADSDHADVAVALFGANDRPPVRINGQVDATLFQRFAETYGNRVAEIARDFKDAGVPLIWVGHPIVRDPAYAEDMASLNAIFAERAQAADAVFVSTWDTFKGRDGGFDAFGRGADGQTARLRADDGVHMTPAGYDVITAMLLPYIDRLRRSDAPKTISGTRQPTQG